MATTVRGFTKREMTRDADGHRQYSITFQVEATSKDEGPTQVLLTAGLPLPGSAWNFGTDNDIWAYCTQEAKVTPREQRDGGRSWWDVDFTFTTRPKNRCSDAQIEDPLLTPPRISGGSQKFQEEGKFDRFGNPIATSSHEAFTGEQAMWDAGRRQYRITQNVPTLYLADTLPTLFLDTLNQYPLWGKAPRTLKLSDASFDEKYYGQCLRYFERTLVWDHRKEGWERNLVDEGTKALKGHWGSAGTWVLDNIAGQPPDPRNPTHFDRFVDKNGNLARVLLAGNGKPYEPRFGEVVPGCERCPAGAPKFWRVAGLAAEVTLEYSSGCTWSVVVAGTTYTLTFSADLSQWLFTNGPVALGSPDTTGWVADPELWQCMGPNALAYSFGPRAFGTVGTPGFGTFPDVIAVMRGDQPGVIHVEKYPSADHLILGIPATL